jgi:hypothetical protein
MEFSSRGFQRSTPSPAAGGPGHAPQPNHPIHKKAAQRIRDSKFLTALWIVFFGAVTVLVIALIFSIATKTGENSIVAGDKYQAVFLNTGQAYFGKIKKVNQDFIDLQDVYYLYNGASSGGTQNQSDANLSLVKLGTELHCPKDQMVIYRDQVTFWENLNDEGKVANAIKSWKDQNKDGVKCSTTAQQGTQQGTSPQQSTTTPTTGTSTPSSSGTSSGNNSSSTTPNP